MPVSHNPTPAAFPNSHVLGHALLGLQIQGSLRFEWEAAEEGDPFSP
jgi:hypothetical protein